MNTIKLFACSTIWITIMLTYYLTAFNIANFSAYSDIQSILMYAISISSTVVAIHLINNYGRKKTLFFCLIAKGSLFVIISLISLFELISSDLIFFILFLVLNFVVGLIYMLITIFTAE